VLVFDHIHPVAAGDPVHPRLAGFADCDPRSLSPDRGDPGSAWDGLAAALLRSPARFSGSGLDGRRGETARELVAEGACLVLEHASEIHYTQGPRRWEGIDRDLRARRGEFPRYADCSALVTWLLWQGLGRFGVPDVVNGANWHAGFISTLLSHGRALGRREPIRLGDLAFYLAGGPHHVAICIGGGKVVSHGTPHGPAKLTLDYRSGLHSIRRYI
jgi:cell wall-associated NlpC family hydrolase